MTRCPLCEGSHPLSPLPYACQDYLTKQTFTLLKCEAGHGYITQGVAPEVDYYGPAYYNSQAGKFAPWLEKIFRFNQQRNARALYNEFHPQAVLEIGCGRAYLLHELQQLGCQVSGLESAQAATWILNNPQVQVMRNDASWPLTAASFQLVIFWHVLEHLPDPLEALRQATRVLEKNQILCISVPNITSYQASLNLATWFHLDVPRHLFHFSRRGLVTILEKQGYEIIRVTSGDTIQNLYGWFQSLANRLTPHATNVLYRFLQGGKPRQTAEKLPLLIQLATFPIWLPLGLAGYLLEAVTGNYGTVTVYARKKF